MDYTKSLEESFKSYQEAKIAFMEQVYHEANDRTIDVIQDTKNSKVSHILNVLRQEIGEEIGCDDIRKGNLDELLRAAINDEPYRFMGKIFKPVED